MAPALTVLHRGLLAAALVFSCAPRGLEGPPAPWRSETPVGGLPMPSLDDERETYRRWGWRWEAGAEPHLPSDARYHVSDPDIHGDTEGDDLWSYLMMYLRTGQRGYRDRAQAWARYFKEDYLACVGSPAKTFCYDREAFGGDHLYGWGLVAWYEYTGDRAALDVAERLAAEVERYWEKRQHGRYPVPGGFAMSYYGLRLAARHLLLVTRVAEATGAPRWAALRDRLIDLWLASPDWDARGMYLVGEWAARQGLRELYVPGLQVQSAFQIGILTEAFAHAYRATGRPALRERLVAMGRFVDAYGLDPTYQYAGSVFGVLDGRPWHNYAAHRPVRHWDPVYTTSLVNTLAYAARYSGDPALRERARWFLHRGTKGVYGSPTGRAAGDAEVHHFVDARLASSGGNFYLAYNKGELQYTYLLFERR